MILNLYIVIYFCYHIGLEITKKLPKISKNHKNKDKQTTAQKLVKKESDMIRLNYDLPSNKIIKNQEQIVINFGIF